MSNSNPSFQQKYSREAPEHDELYHKMIEEVEDYAILMLNREGYIISWNKGAEKIKGYKAEEIISKSFRIFYTKEDQERRLPEKLLQLGAETGKAHHEGWRVRKDGTTFWGSIVITAVHSDTGDVIGFTKVTRDLTERKIAEDYAKAQAARLEKVNQDLLIAQEELQHKIEALDQLNKDLEQFAYIASHDLQEPVRKISAYFSMLCQLLEGKFDPRALNFKNKIIASTNRMRALINDLLTLSTITESVVMIPVDLNKVVQEAVDGLDVRIHEKNATVEIHQLPFVAGIESYLIQLFMNLIGNALKFSQDAPLIRISGETKGKKVIIKIQDNGIGIEKKYLKQIFEAFKRLHPKHLYEGTGIGLTICKKIVDALHGEIEVESQPGTGTTFTITLNAA